MQFKIFFKTIDNDYCSKIFLFALLNRSKHHYKKSPSPGSKFPYFPLKIVRQSMDYFRHFAWAFKHMRSHAKSISKAEAWQPLHSSDPQK